MNFLAHIYLSGSSDNILLGNFIGDFVKGNDLNNYPDPVREGIVLHRKIDYFTDHHPSTGLSKDLLWPHYRHYSGVIVDMFYDHLLAVHWKRFHPDPLTDFSGQVYRLLNSRQSEMPHPARYMLPYMIRGDWLTQYRTVEGIRKSLTGMSRRTTFVSHMENATADLQAHFAEFEAHFLAFFPDMLEYVAEENPFFKPPETY